jgi:ATP-binding cassette subfamily C (CFTR/MRP) protein 1
MLHTTEGAITIDGIDIECILPNTLREHITVIPQDPFIQPQLSVRANLDPLSTSCDNMMLAALNQVGLDDTVCNHGGLDVPFEAIGFTSGQTKLLGIARALVKKVVSGARSGILLLDEATAGMDDRLETLVMQIVHDGFQDFTVIAIAHRMNSIRDFDRVIVMDAGHVAEVSDVQEFLQSLVADKTMRVEA